jgi:hypothetical protein
LDRIQVLTPDKMVEFYNFQKHRRNSFPKVLQGETPTPPTTQQTETQGLETVSSSGWDARKNLEETEDLMKKAEENP